jgi:hypothetical protein
MWYCSIRETIAGLLGPPAWHNARSERVQGLEPRTREIGQIARAFD